MSDYIGKMNAQAFMRKHYEWGKWMDEIPMLEIPKGILIKAIPPFGGAVIRYKFSHRSNPSKDISVYLDCYDELGVMEKPYWEIYPASDGDTARFLMNDTEGLMNAITEALASKETQSERTAMLECIAELAGALSEVKEDLEDRAIDDCVDIGNSAWHKLNAALTRAEQFLGVK